MPLFVGIPLLGFDQAILLLALNYLVFGREEVMSGCSAVHPADQSNPLDQCAGCTLLTSHHTHHTCQTPLSINNAPVIELEAVATSSYLCSSSPVMKHTNKHAFCLTKTATSWSDF